MGENKAFLSLEGATLIERTKSILAEVCETVSIIGSRELYGAFGPCFEDIYTGCGPLGGIHAALLNSTTAHNLITAVDTPFLTPKFLRYLAGKALDSTALVTAPSVAGRVQPLCAIFSREFLTVAEAALREGKYKVEPLFPREHTQILTERELGEFALAPGMFDNLNTPEDFERARSRKS